MIVWDNSSLLVDLTHSRTASPTSFSLPNLARRMAVFWGKFNTTVLVLGHSKLRHVS